MERYNLCTGCPCAFLLGCVALKEKELFVWAALDALIGD